MLSVFALRKAKKKGRPFLWDDPSYILNIESNDYSNITSPVLSQPVRPQLLQAQHPSEQQP